MFHGFLAFQGFLATLGPLVTQTIKQGFQKHIMVDIPFTVALVKYVDHMLQTNVVDHTTADGALQVFRFVTAKDVFGQHYQLLLSKQMLIRTNNIDVERFIIAGLHDEWGNSYTTKLENMLRDEEVGIWFHEDVDALLLPGVEGDCDERLGGSTTLSLTNRVV